MVKASPFRNVLYPPSGRGRDNFLFRFSVFPNIDYNDAVCRIAGLTNISGGNNVIRRLLLISLTLISIIPAVCCSTLKEGKNIAIDNPMNESKKKQSLNDARQAVERSRSALDKCLEASSGDQTRCQSEKAAYDEDVKNYVSLQSE
jgi:hypothetical protein